MLIKMKKGLLTKCILKYDLENEDHFTQGLYALSSKTSYHQISSSLEAARMNVIKLVSL